MTGEPSPKVLVVGSSGTRELLGHAAADHVAGLDGAFRSLDREEFDAIVVDLDAVDPAGPDVIPALAGAAPRTAIVVTTASGDDPAGLAAIRAGAQDHVGGDEMAARALLRTIRYAIERKKREQSIARHAHYDPLTDLANRALFRERLDHALARADRTGKTLAVLWLDLDGFRAATEGWSREDSDEVIRQVGVRLHRSVRQVDTVARPGGDEFTILLEGLDRPRAAEIVARKIAMALTEPLLRDPPLRLSASIGIGWYPGGSDDRDALLSHAEAALGDAKRRGGGGFSFDPPAPN